MMRRYYYPTHPSYNYTGPTYESSRFRVFAFWFIVCTGFFSLITFILALSGLVVSLQTQNRACPGGGCTNGSSPMITVGSTETLPCGESANVTNVGNDTNVILDFMIPEGCDGENATITVTIVNQSSSPNTSIIIYNTTEFNIYINISDNGTFISTPGPPGPEGPQGEPGVNGTDGIDGTNGTDGANGTCIPCSNGTNGIDGTNGTNGLDGRNGTDGLDGTNGTNGLNGRNGTDGTNGTDGLNGRNGTDGTNGTNGINGRNGTDGTNGTNGIDGRNGTDGTNGINGRNGTDGTNGTNGASGTNGTNGMDGNSLTLFANFTVGQPDGVLKGDLVSVVDNKIYRGYGSPTAFSLNNLTMTSNIVVGHMSDNVNLVFYIQTTATTISQGFVMVVTNVGSVYSFGTPVLVPCTATGGATPSQVNSADPISITVVSATTFAIAYRDSSSVVAGVNRICGGSISGSVVSLSTVGNTLALVGTSVAAGDSITQLRNFKVRYIRGSTTGAVSYFLIVYRNQSPATKQINMYLAKIDYTTPTNPVATIVLGTNVSTIVTITPIATASTIDAFSTQVFTGNVSTASFAIWWTNNAVPAASAKVAVYTIVYVGTPAITLTASGQQTWDTGTSASPNLYGKNFISITLTQTIFTSAKCLLTYQNTDLNGQGAARVFNFNLASGAMTVSASSETVPNFLPSINSLGIFYPGDNPATAPWSLDFVTNSTIAPFSIVLFFQDGSNGGYGKSMIITVNASDYMVFNRFQRFAVNSITSISPGLDSNGSISLFYVSNFRSPISGNNGAYVTYIQSTNLTTNLFLYTRTKGNEPVGITLDAQPAGGQVRVASSGIISLDPSPGVVNTAFGNLVPGEVYWMHGDASYNQDEQKYEKDSIPIEGFRAINESAIIIATLSGS